MAQTAAQRQAAARARRRNQAVGAEKGEHAHQINTFIKASAANALRRMARHHGVSQRELLERMLTEAEELLTHGWSEHQIDQYYNL
jgi:LAS superfamily LD-carboxypeptidase LdcB